MDRIFNSRPDKKLTNEKFLKKANARTINELWIRHIQTPFVIDFKNLEYDKYLKNNSKSVKYILIKAEKILEKKIDLLGTGEIFLGKNIIWNKDYKTGKIWNNKYYRDINYVDFNDKSDVKIPWEISRMQWLIPVGQAYLLTGNEKYAIFVKDILEDWINNNTYGHSINWTCTMEVALRIIIWQWFFYVFSESKAWKSEKFKFIFLKTIYLHSYFTIRNLEKSDVNGNHYTADGAGLIFAGLFFKGYDNESKSFLNVGLDIIYSEIKLQVFPDGVDYEASIPYHRLVTELFYFSGLFLINSGYDLKQFFIDKIIKMGDFIKSYSRHNESVPLFGDADDARVLPMGLQSINDHSYLASLIGLTHNSSDLILGNTSTHDEIFWILGFKELIKLPKPVNGYFSKAYDNGGFYIMGNNDSHIFIDCGPLGLLGRGGHGHNDILSFDALIQGEHVISDCGAYLYTADYIERNKFRSTSYHNTPMVDKKEINRFISDKYLWNLKNDALPKLLKWQSDDDYDVFIGSHTGYERLKNSVSPIRTIILKKKSSELLISDIIVGNGNYEVEIPLHFHPDIKITEADGNSLNLFTGNKEFKLFWKGTDWICSKEKTRISPSYGVSIDSKKLKWFCNNGINKRLSLLITMEKSKSYAFQEIDLLLSKFNINDKTKNK